MAHRRKRDTYNDVLGNVLSNIRVRDEVNLPREHSHILWSLELNFVGPVITIMLGIGIGVRNIGDLEGRDDSTIEFVVGEDNPP
jgi:hypothetical protein